MSARFQSEDCGVVRGPQRGIERLRRALQHLSRLLAASLHPEALVPIPIRAAPPPDARGLRRRPRSD